MSSHNSSNQGSAAEAQDEVEFMNSDIKLERT